MNFYIGQFFMPEYPPEAAQWCNGNSAVMVEVEGGFEIQALPAPTFEGQLAAIDTKYQQKFNELKESFTSAMIIDGAPMETNVALLRTKWAALIAAQQAEIDTVFSQE